MQRFNKIILRQLIKAILRRILFFKYGELFYRDLTGSTLESVQERARTIKYLADTYRLDIFVETGTYLGDTTWSLKGHFKKLYTIELEPSVAAFAKRRFKKYPHIMVLRGNSAKVLSDLLPRVKDRCLFFLDAHYSGGISGRGKETTPIQEELAVIKNHSVKNHVIIIDDAKEFDGTKGYPTKEEVKKQLLSINPVYKIEEKEDFIIAVPAT